MQDAKKDELCEHKCSIKRQHKTAIIVWYELKVLDGSNCQSKDWETVWMFMSVEDFNKDSARSQISLL